VPRPGRARLDLRLGPGHSVSDQGIGIDPADHERIFERFGRAASSRHFAGLGLGLWATREIVQRMGGAVRVRSALGQGATFTVALPKEA
jgi:signal transduction histidine kinase